MTDPMVSSYDPPRAERIEVITSVQRRRRWTTEEKVRIVDETYLPGNPVSIIARRHGISANQLFTWRRLMARGAFTAAGACEEVVPVSELRAAHQQIRELQRLLGKKTLENELLREAVERVAAPKKLPLRVSSWPGDGRCVRSPRHWAFRAHTSPPLGSPCRDGVGVRRSLMPSCWPQSRRSSPICRPTATGACMLCCAGRLSERAGPLPT